MHDQSNSEVYLQSTLAQVLCSCTFDLVKGCTTWVGFSSEVKMFLKSKFYGLFVGFFIIVSQVWADVAIVLPKQLIEVPDATTTPFSIAAENSARYQQVFAASAFSKFGRPVLIKGIS